MRIKIFLVFICLLLLLTGDFSPANSEEAKLPKCLLVMSYHSGYVWQDSIEEAVRNVLRGKCQLRQFNMDSKRDPSVSNCKNKALEAKVLIESWKPDVIIASDDNASKYLVAPYFKDKKVPIVFCGVNYTVEEYGYPYSNVTGMIETDPIKPLKLLLVESIPDAKTAVALTTDHLTSNKIAARFQQYFSSTGITVIIKKARTMDEFEREFVAAQASDFVVLINSTAIGDWDDNRAKKIITRHTKKLTITFGTWMSSYAVLTMDTFPREHGDYAAQVALKILAGAKPSDFPIIANREWNIYLNEVLLKIAEIKLPKSIVHKVEKLD